MFSEVYQYLKCIKNMEGLSWSKQESVLPTNISRAYFHEQMCRQILGFDEDEHQHRYIRLKKITDNLDKVCELYSTSNEWQMKNEYELIRMSEFLTILLEQPAIVKFLNTGEISEACKIKWLKET